MVQMDDRVKCYGIDQQGGKSNCGYFENVMPTLCSDSHGTPHAVCYDARGNGDGRTTPTITGDHNNRITDYTTIVVSKREDPVIDWKSAGNGQLNNITMQPIANALDCMHDAQMIVGKNDKSNGRKYILRRLTPTECARLQGFPDWWVDGANGSDTSVYKLWGNGISLPCSYDVLRRIARSIENGKEDPGDDP